MAIVELFSKRQKRVRGEMPDVYVFNQLPDNLRIQIVHIIKDAFGKDTSYGFGRVENAFGEIKNILCREYGLFELVTYPKSNSHSVFEFFLQEENVELALDVVEICFKYISLIIPEDNEYKLRTVNRLPSDNAINELNARFKERGVGYQFESHELIRVDSEYLHSEVVKPTLAVLRGPQFAGANEEFLSAHEHYRHGRNKECLVDCLKALESTLKAICDARGWEYKSGATAKPLIDICFSNLLLPSYLESQFASIRALFESGVPTLRNKNGGHGQGSELLAVPDFMVRYTLNLTATSILFLVEANDSFLE